MGGHGEYIFLGDDAMRLEDLLFKNGKKKS